MLISTLVQGSTFEPLARWLGTTSAEPALPRPLTETGTIRGLGAEVVEYAVGEGDSIAGRRVRDLGLPREALVNVIVRDGEAIPPRGSTRVEPRDRLHILVRKEVASQFDQLIQLWRSGPAESIERQRPVYPGHPPVFSVRPWAPADGDPARPTAVAGRRVVELLRSRHDKPGSVVVLEDGRYAATGALLIIGSARQVREQALKCMRGADHDTERAWWQEVIGALAV